MKAGAANSFLESEMNSREEPYGMEDACDSPAETIRKRQICELVPVPVHDPICGEDGPMQQIWRKD